MGYSERACQLCAVSLNTARIRLPHEPAEAGWGYSGGLYYSTDEESSKCSLMHEKSGCKNVKNEEAGSDFIHFPGPGCCFEGAYSGLRIGADEMKGMNLPRYIIRKPQNGDFEGEEQSDFEQKSDFFVTSQTTCPPDDFEPGELAKVRFGISDFFPRNYLVIEDEQDCGVPIHASCWKIFERVAKLRLVIARCREQFWVHLPGTEFLEADPEEIPGWPMLLLEVYSRYSSNPDGGGVFLTHRKSNQVYDNSTDIFNVFPPQLRNMILDGLDSNDIASLRLASRSFRQLPQALFKRLIHDEMPWFWVFDDLVISSLEYNDLAGEHNKDDTAARDVNWLEMYKHLSVAKRAVLGVRNRARTWTAVEEVVRRIGQLRERSRDDVLQVMPTEQEKEMGLVKHDFYCPRCEIFQIEGHT